MNIFGAFTVWFGLSYGCPEAMTRTHKQFSGSEMILPSFSRTAMAEYLLNETGYWAIANIYSNDCGSQFQKWLPVVNSTEGFTYPIAAPPCFKHHNSNLQTIYRGEKKLYYNGTEQMSQLWPPESDFANLFLQNRFCAFMIVVTDS